MNYFAETIHTLAGCATASTTAKTAEATDHYLLEIDR